MKKTVLLWIFAVLSAVFIGFLVVKGTENFAISMEEGIENSRSAIKVQEKRRYDLIPNLVECVKDYNRHEYETIKAIAESRGNTAEGAEEVKTLINAVAEAYPELKSVENYKNLMIELELTENKIAELRRGYNNDVTEYKKYIRKFPSKQFLGLAGYEPVEVSRLEVFEYTSEDAPSVSF